MISLLVLNERYNRNHFRPIRTATIEYIFFKNVSHCNPETVFCGAFCMMYILFNCTFTQLDIALGQIDIHML